MLKKYGVESVKQLDGTQLKNLCQDLRDTILERVSLNGGHLASNLGAIEATVALHCVFDFPKDKIVFDVGHQCYAHKLLSDRAERFSTLRRFGGISGFPKRAESEYDSFDTGHAGSAISASLGIAKARDLKGEKHSVIAFVGDGSFLNGLVFEALNSLKILKTNILIILNDNGMSISPTVGGLHDIFSGPVDRRVKLLEAFGLTYLGVADGNNVEEMISSLTKAKQELEKGPVLLHIATKKGAGYCFSEEHPTQTHGVSPEGVAKEYSEMAGKTLCDLAAENSSLVAVTAAMTDSLGLRPFFDRYSERSFDVGICEEHACVLCAGMATQGLHTYYAIYSTFLQRAYDELIHDISCQDLPVTFLIDRAGVSGSDGETHQGVFDLSYLSAIPNMTVAVPKNRKELKELILFSEKFPHPLAIRYPRAGTDEEEALPVKDFSWEVLQKGEKIVFLCAGERAISLAREASRRLLQEATIVNARFIKPLDTDYLSQIEENTVVTIEDGVGIGGFGERVKAYFGKEKQVLTIAYGDEFLPQGKVSELMEKFGWNADEVLNRLTK